MIKRRDPARAPSLWAAETNRGVNWVDGPVQAADGRSDHRPLSRSPQHPTGLPPQFRGDGRGRVTVSVTKLDETGPCPVKPGRPAAVLSYQACS